MNNNENNNNINNNNEPRMDAEMAKRYAEMCAYEESVKRYNPNRSAFD